MSRYANKRMHFRTVGGQFRKATMQDVGIGGTCRCGSFLLRHYDGDPRDTSPNPKLFRYRCFSCEPRSDDEKSLQAEIESAKPKAVSLHDFFNSILK